MREDLQRAGQVYVVRGCSVLALSEHVCGLKTVHGTADACWVHECLAPPAL